MKIIRSKPVSTRRSIVLILPLQWWVSRDSKFSIMTFRKSILNLTTLSIRKKCATQCNDIASLVSVITLSVVCAKYRIVHCWVVSLKYIRFSLIYYKVCVGKRTEVLHLKCNPLRAPPESALALLSNIRLGWRGDPWLMYQIVLFIVP